MNEYNVLVGKFVILGSLILISMTAMIKFLIQPMLCNTKRDDIIFTREKPKSLLLVSLLYFFYSISYLTDILDLNNKILIISLCFETIMLLLLGINLMSTIYDKFKNNYILMKIYLYIMGFSIFLIVAYLVYEANLVISISSMLSRFTILILALNYVIYDILYNLRLKKYNIIIYALIFAYLTQFLISGIVDTTMISYVLINLFGVITINIIELDLGKLIIKRMKHGPSE